MGLPETLQAGAADLRDTTHSSVQADARLRTPLSERLLVNVLQICDDVPAERPPITEPLDIIRVDNKPVPIRGPGIPDFPDEDADDEL